VCIYWVEGWRAEAAPTTKSVPNPIILTTRSNSTGGAARQRPQAFSTPSLPWPCPEELAFPRPTPVCPRSPQRRPAPSLPAPLCSVLLAAGAAPGSRIQECIGSSTSKDDAKLVARHSSCRDARHNEKNLLPSGTQQQEKKSAVCWGPGMDAGSGGVSAAALVRHGTPDYAESMWPSSKKVAEQPCNNTHGAPLCSSSS